MVVSTDKPGLQVTKIIHRGVNTNNPSIEASIDGQIVRVNTSIVIY